MRASSADLIHSVVYRIAEDPQVSLYRASKTINEPNIGQVDIEEFEGFLAHAPPRFWHVEKAWRDLRERSDIQRQWQPCGRLKRTIILRSSTVRPFIAKALVAASTLEKRTVA